MDMINAEEIKMLSEKRDSPCFSLFIPTLRKGDQVQQGSIRLKNHLQKIEISLKDRGFKSHQINSLIAQAVDMLNDKGYWFHQSDGLAVFITQGFTRAYRVPINFTEENIESNSFYLTPLLPMLTGNGNFYILGIDQGNIKLYKADRDKIEELEIKDVPLSFDEYMETEESIKGPQNRVQTTSMSQPHPVSTQNDRGGSFHGQGESTDGRFHKKKIVDFFHWAEDGVHEILKGKNEPLVLAGQDFLIPLWKEVNNYTHVYPEHLLINPLSITQQELHKRAWETVSPEFYKSMTSSLHLFGQFRSRNLATTSFKEIVQAAYSKRIDTLFVKKNSKIWGIFNTSSLKVNIDEEQTDSSIELLNYASNKTIESGGVVYLLDHSKMPEGAAAAAIFRF